MSDLFDDFVKPFGQKEPDIELTDKFYDNVQFTREQEAEHERVLAQRRGDRDTGIMCFGYDKADISPDEFNPF